MDGSAARVWWAGRWIVTTRPTPPVELEVLGPARILSAPVSTARPTAAELLVLALVALHPAPLDEAALAALARSRGRKEHGLVAGVEAARRLFDERRASVRLVGPASGPWRLDAPDGAIDVQRFDDAVSTGARALDEGGLDEAAGAVADASALWRGTPFAGLAGWAPADRAGERLWGGRRLVVHIGAWLELAGGRPGNGAALLRELPDERLDDAGARLLVSCLALSGQRAEAVATVGRWNRRRSTTPAIRDLEERLLDGELPAVDRVLDGTHPSRRGPIGG